MQTSHITIPEFRKNQEWQVQIIPEQFLGDRIMQRWPYLHRQKKWSCVMYHISTPKFCSDSVPNSKPYSEVLLRNSATHSIVLLRNSALNSNLKTQHPTPKFRTPLRNLTPKFRAKFRPGTPTSRSKIPFSFTKSISTPPTFISVLAHSS